jgi:hypothetical protein
MWFGLPILRVKAARPARGKRYNFVLPRDLYLKFVRLSGSRGTVREIALRSNLSPSRPFCDNQGTYRNQWCPRSCGGI